MSSPTISRDLLGKIVDEVFDGAIEDASVIEEIYAAIKRHESLSPVPLVMGSDRDDGVTVGIAMSVAFLLRDRDDPVPALEWWQAAGLTIEQCERVGLDGYDLDPIRAALASATEGSGE